MTLSTKALRAHLGRREILEGVDLNLSEPKLAGVMSLDGPPNALLDAIRYELAPAAIYLSIRDLAPPSVRSVRPLPGDMHDELMRAALDRALAYEPRCLLIDDSLFIQDEERQSRWMAALRQLPISVFVALREPGAVKECDWLYIIEYGRVQRQGPPTL